jgi:hypothetical protein
LHQSTAIPELGTSNTVGLSDARVDAGTFEEKEFEVQESV